MKQRSKYIMYISVILAVVFVVCWGLHTKYANAGVTVASQVHPPAPLEDHTIPSFPQLTVGEMQSKIQQGDSFYAYFFNPTCPYCQKADKILVPMLKGQSNINLYLVNVQGNQKAWNDYHLLATPTIIQYKQGNEVMRLDGLQTSDIYQQFFGIPTSKP